MNYFYILLAAFAAYLIFSYAWIGYRRYAKMPAIIQHGFEMGNGQPLRYIAAGDSTAVGVGASAVEKTYPHGIAAYLAQKNRVIYKNVAVSGAKTADVVRTQLPQIIAYHPDVVTISIGPNDVTHLVTNNTILKNFKTIIQTLTAHTRAQIYITDAVNFKGASLLPWWYIRILDAKEKRLNAEILKLGNDRIRMVNIYDFGWHTFPKKSLTFSFDHFHPNDLGYQNWTNAFLDAMKG